MINSLSNMLSSYIYSEEAMVKRWYLVEFAYTYAVNIYHL
jgi:hypothetical protein